MKRNNIQVMRESIATGMIFELPGEDRRTTLTLSRNSVSGSARLSRASMSFANNLVKSGKYKSQKLVRALWPVASGQWPVAMHANARQPT